MEYFKFTDSMPIAALSIGQFKELINSMLSQQIPNQYLPVNNDEFPETFGKDVCSRMTGYTVNTISKMVSKRRLPFYKRDAKVIFKRDEIRAWLLSNRVETVEEFVAGKENELCLGRRN